MRGLVAGVALSCLFGCTQSDPGASAPREPPHPTAPESSINADCERGPWSQHCPEAEWARSVLANAGFRLTGDSGSALTATDGQVIFHFWAFTPNEQRARLDQALARENYRELPEREKGAPIYTDGIRFAWSARGLWVWLTSAGIENGTPGGTAAEVRRAVLDDLVTASTRTSLDGSREESASLRDIGLHPESYAIGTRLEVVGWLIKPPRSVLFVCDEISDDYPPRAVGSCSEVENEELLDSKETMRVGRTRWIPEPVNLACEVSGYRPGDVNPERLTMSCKRQ